MAQEKEMGETKTMYDFDAEAKLAIEEYLDAAYVTEIEVGVVSARLQSAYAAGLRRAAEIARETKVIHGDHYAAYYAPSTDAEDISPAILKEAGESK